ncbi:DUF4935 domain-containing protein [Alicyclobacillus curvatus]|nr:DUF4935 domain-containing protein [Alicyclobacillus curvatus]
MSRRYLNRYSLKGGRTIHTFTIDTCDLYYIAEGKTPVSVLEAIERLIREQLLLLITPVTIHNEWIRHRGEIVDKRVKSIKELSKHVRNLTKDFDAEVGPLDRIREWLLDLESRESNLRSSAEERVSRIDFLLEHSHIVEPDSWVEKETVKLGLAQQAPFHPKKNSTADAVNFLTVVNYLRNAQGNYDASFFISYNHTDFSQPDQPNDVLHQHLQPYADMVGLRYNHNIAQAINDVQRLIEDIDVQSVEQLRPEPRFNEVCPNCHTVLERLRDGGWKMGPFGLTYYMFCNQCGFSWDTGYTFD